jgi:hypothetical protein
MAEAVRELGERAEMLMWSPMSGTEAVIAVHWKATTGPRHRVFAESTDVSMATTDGSLTGAVVMCVHRQELSMTGGEEVSTADAACGGR